MHQRQRTLVFGAGGDQHHRRRARNDGEELGHNRLADRIDPLGVIDDVKRRFSTGQRHGVDQGGQPAPPRIRIDLGQRHLGVGDAQQVIEQQQILRVCIRHAFANPGPRGFALQVFDPAQRAQQPRHRVEGNIVGMRFAVDPHHLDPATGRGRRGLPRHPALADTWRSHHGHDTTAATGRAVHHGVEGGHLPAPTDQAHLGAPDQALPRPDRQQPVRAYGLVGALDGHPHRFRKHHRVLDQSGGELAKHHPTGRRDRLHPLRHPHLLTDRGVPQRRLNRSHRRSPDRN